MTACLKPIALRYMCIPTPHVSLIMCTSRGLWNTLCARANSEYIAGAALLGAVNVLVCEEQGCMQAGTDLNPDVAICQEAILVHVVKALLESLI